MSTDAGDRQQGETVGSLLVADLLRREGFRPAKKLPALPGRRRESPDFGGDDAPTIQLSVAELLRRENDVSQKERSGKRTTITIAAGVAALFGLAAVAFGAIQPHDSNTLTSAGGPGDGSGAPAPNTTTLATLPDSATNASAPVPVGTPVLDKGKAPVAAPTSSSGKVAARAAAGSARTRDATPRSSSPAAATTPETTGTTATPSPSSSAPAPSTGGSKPPSTPTPPSGTTSPSQTPPSNDNGGLLGSVTGLADGVISGLLGN